MKNKINIKIIKAAYLMLKNYYYYDTTDLFVKKQFAKYEEQHSYKADDIFNSLKKEIDSIMDNYEDIRVDFHLLPKKVEENKDEKVEKDDFETSFLSNVRDEDIYKLKVNYFIDVDLHIRVLDTIWVMTKGKEIDSQMLDCVYANRLSNFELIPKVSNVLFKKYFTQYSTWRDKALKTAKDLVQQDKNVIILSTDLESFFYSISVNFNDKELQDEYGIYNIIQYIHDKYTKKVNQYFNKTHNKNLNKNIVPIGLLSSNVLSNWCLKQFDEEITTKANPIYYGRYVDDILIVIHTNTNNIKEKLQCIKLCLKDIVNYDNKNGFIKYSTDFIDLNLKDEKTIVHFLNSKNSIASLKIFESEIQKNTSMFRFLPTEEAMSKIEDVAYDLFYYGSKYKFRSIVNFKENATKFSTYLSTQIILQRLTDMKNEKNTQEDIAKFFKGRNYLDFARFWLKYLYFLEITQDKKNINNFIQDIKDIIKKSVISNSGNSKTTDDEITEILKRDLTELLNICRQLAQAINNDNIYRKSNILDNTYVSFPLVNFTDYTKPLNKIDLKEVANKELDKNKMVLCPRFIHFDEFCAFKINQKIYSNLDIDYQKIIEEYQQFVDCEINNNIIIYNNHEINSTNIRNIAVKDIRVQQTDEQKDKSPIKNFSKKIKIGIVNIKIPEEQIKQSYINGGTNPVVTLKRELELFSILNMAEKEKVNMLIFPELSIPYKWFPQILQFSRRHQISFVFGLEYIIRTKGTENIACNYVVTTLPFINKKYNTLLPIIRLKNHYAPQEIRDLQDHNYGIPSLNKYMYNMFEWNGIKFTTFICYELADILHRSIFKLNIDLLTSCVWNKDINYYDHILSSTVRDLHCYLAESNTSQYGESCILQPTKTETLSIAKIKGGENSTIITAELDINALKYFHSLNTNNHQKDFKPIPPGEKIKISAQK